VGDAGRFIDPIFSSGVYLSMKSGYLVANALHEMFVENNLDENAPVKEAYKKINGAYDLVFRLIDLFYNPHTITFAEAGAVFNLEHKEHEDALAAGHYILAGDFFEQNQKYHEFLDLLATPHAFEHYRNHVINREELNVAECDVDRSLIFPPVNAESALIEK